MTAQDPPAQWQQTVDLMWGVAKRPSRGPKPSLTVEAVVKAAIAIADEEGLSALSMRRLADRLSAGTMAIYRYVPGRDDLLDLISDAAMPPGPSRPPVSGQWRVELAFWALEMLEVHRRRPWLLEITISGPPMGPHKISWLDWALQALGKLPISESEKVGLVMALSSYVLGFAETDIDIAQSQSRTKVSPQQWAPVYGRVLERVLSDGRFPGLAAAVSGGAFAEEDTDPNADFNFGLQVILDGVAGLIETKSRPEV